MLSKLAKEQDIKPNEPISVSPTTGYTSWFTIWNTKKQEKGEEKEEDNASDTSEIFKLSEDETSKLPVDIEDSDNENQDTGNLLNLQKSNLYGVLTLFTNNC